MVPIVERLYLGESAVAWRTATRDGGLVHAQVLNLSRARGLQTNPVVVFYVPDAGFGVPHAVATFAGLAYGWAGVNVGGITVSETDDLAAPNFFAGGRVHHLPVLRQTLYDSLSLRESIAVASDVPASKPETLLFGDGRNENRGAKVFTDPDFPTAVVLANDPTDPLAPNVLADIVYGGATPASSFSFLQIFRGDLNLGFVGDAASLRNFTSAVSLQGNNVLNVLMDARNFTLYVAYGTTTVDARAVPFAAVNLQDLLP
jgi:hypothetical protein